MMTPSVSRSVAVGSEARCFDTVVWAIISSAYQQRDLAPQGAFRGRFFGFWKSTFFGGEGQAYGASKSHVSGSPSRVHGFNSRKGGGHFAPST
jgi:hypothetical protein